MNQKTDSTDITDTEPIIMGQPDLPCEEPQYSSRQPDSIQVLLPGLEPEEAHPLEVHCDFWGRNPRLQMLCYDHASDEGEPVVVVRYNATGKIVEVLVGNTTLIKDSAGEFVVRPYSNTVDTPWEIERDSNPPCREGDRLMMPSMAITKVMRLHERYLNDIDEMRRYDITYRVFDRLNDSLPRDKRYESLEDMWEDNPLTAGTVNPGDFSIVPERVTG